MSLFWITSFLALGVLCVVGVLAGVAHLSGIGRRPNDFPPGPPTLPIIGNLHLMPKRQQHVAFQKWAQEYGPIYSLILGSQVMIVLSSDTAVKDLLDKRSAIYSSRPEMYIANMAKGWMEFSLLPYGNTWRTMRRFVHSAVNVTAAKTYVPYQDLENKQMLVELLDSPGDFVAQIQRYTFSLTHQMLVGYRVMSRKAPNIEEFYTNMHEFSEIVSSSMASLLEIFSILSWVPERMLSDVKRAKVFREREKKSLVGIWMQIKKQILAGTAKPCVAEILLRSQQIEGMSDEQAAYNLGVLHEGGADTSAATLHAFVEAMVLYPAVQVQARAELDRVCGRRLPTMADHAQLPYLRASVKEALRWFPTVALGIPHTVVREDTYRGYRIPQGASIVPNIWTLNHDPARYARPRVFDPARFLGDDTTAAESAASTDVAKRDHFSFGAGRRICPGMHIAERTIFLAIARLLWGFEFSKATQEAIVPDAEGQTASKGRRTVVEITPDQDTLVDGLLYYPTPFPAHIVPRSAHHAAAMREAWAECQDLLDAEGQWKVVPDGMFKSGYTGSADLGYNGAE